MITVINISYSMRKILSKNPFTYQINKQFEYISNQDLQKKIDRSYEAFQISKNRRIQERASMISSLGDVFDKNQNKIAQTITIEMGKPIKQSRAEVAKTVSFCKHFSKNFNELLPTQIKTDARVKTLIKYDPLGIIYHIVPFNVPFYLNFKGGLSNLLLGNSLLVRNSDSTPLLGELTQKLVQQAGFDSGEYQNVFTSHQQLDSVLCRNQVMGVCFTGSTNSGSMIAQKAGKHLKKSVMELGGNDPFVVLKDANLELAINDAFQFRCANAGQICFSPKRFIIAKELYEKFRDGLIQKFKNVKYGDPMEESTEMGPLAREDLHDNLHKQLKSLPSSWKIYWQQENISKPLFPITLVEASDHQYLDQEMFGPVFTFFKAENEEHAIQIANRGTFGLGSSVYSKTRGQQVVSKIRSGMCFVNSPTKSMANFPSGGVGKSGYGRQCGVQGMKQFANIRVYYIN